MEQHYENLKDVSRPYDVNQILALNTLVEAIYTGSNEQRALANKILSEVKDHPEAWARCEELLVSSQTSLNTKFFALSIYDSVSASRWIELPREKILNTVLELIKTIAVRGSQEEKPLLRKLDKVFVNAVKNEWLNGTEMWKGVIPQLASLSGSDQNLWENTMNILNMLSEDIFDFGTSTMTAKKIALLKNTLSEQFPHVQRLCEVVLTQHVQSPQNTVKVSLVNAALSTMSHYLKWIPPPILFGGSNFIDVLIANFWDPPAFRIECVKCLGEVFSIPCVPTSPSDIATVGMYQQKMAQWFMAVCLRMNATLPRSILIDRRPPSANERLFYETLFNQFSIMFHGLIKVNFPILSANLSESVQLLQILVKITDIAPDEGFKSFVLMWLSLSENLVSGARQAGRQVEQDPNDILAQYIQEPLLGEELGVPASPAVISSFIPVLSELGKALILRMAQPPEVTITENEDGEIVREDTKDTAEIDLYNSMSKCLQNITFIDRSLIEGTLLSMLKELTASVRVSVGNSSSTVNWDSSLLSRITWSAGSIAGVTPSVESEAAERRFTFEMIRELLGMCNIHNNRTNRAIVASNVLFYCARHHRFLRANHKFLRTVYKKLFEFMSEQTPGVKEMASDTFLVISRSCAHKLVDTIQESGATYSPFIDSLVAEIHPFINHLEPLQKCTIFEGVGIIISAINATDLVRQEQLCFGFLSPYFERWSQILATANQSTQLVIGVDLFSCEILRDLSLCLRVFERLAFGLGRGVVVEKLVLQIYEDMLKLYKVYSETIAQNEKMINYEYVKLMRRVKGDCLRLISTFVDISVKPKGMPKKTGTESGSVAASVVPRLLDYVLEDYRTAKPQAKDHEVLLLLSSLCRNLSDSISPAVGMIFEKMFATTREMFGADPRSYPEHRVGFYEFLKNLNAFCFVALVRFLLESDQLGVFLDTVVAGIQNDHPQVADLGLSILNQFIENLATKAGPNECGLIFGRIFHPLVTVILGVLTDKLHDSGKDAQIRVLMHLLAVVVRGNAGQDLTVDIAESHLTTIISQIGVGILPAQRETFVRALVNSVRNGQSEIFKQLMNDLKITICYGGTLDI